MFKLHHIFHIFSISANNNSDKNKQSIKIIKLKKNILIASMETSDLHFFLENNSSNVRKIFIC